MAQTADVLIVGSLVTASATAALWHAWASPAEQACRADADVLESVRCAPERLTSGVLKWASVALGAVAVAAMAVSLTDVPARSDARSDRRLDARRGDTSFRRTWPT